MRITTTQPLFAWEALEDSPSLQTLREFLAAVPDAKLLDSLRQRRGQGRDDDPVSVLGGTLKYRCSARHEGWTCPSAGRCNAGKSYGLTVRVKQEIDLRRFPPIPRATKNWQINNCRRLCGVRVESAT